MPFSLPSTLSSASDFAGVGCGDPIQGATVFPVVQDHFILVMTSWSHACYNAFHKTALIDILPPHSRPTVLAAAYVLFVWPTLHPYLAFPRVETLVAGLLIVALTFYSSLAINGPQSEWKDSKVAAVMILTCVTLPYALFMWWITWGRVVLHRRVSMDVFGFNFNFFLTVCGFGW